MTVPPSTPPGWPGSGYPPGYPPPVYGGYPAYGGYPGYPPPYPGAPWAPAWKPGIIPLRPLLLSDIFIGAVIYVRSNPAATLGLTTLIVVLTSILQLIVEVALPQSDTGPGMLAGSLTAGLTTALATILLSGMLTVVVARSVAGRRITIAEAWQRVRGRLPTLIGLSLLEIAAVALLVGSVVLLIAGVARAANGALALLVGVPLGLLTLAALAYLFTVLIFAPVAVVLERTTITEAIRRSYELAIRNFWRILGIRALASVAAGVVSAAVAVPFGVLSGLLMVGPEPSQLALLAVIVSAVGGAIGQIITAPFSAGVVVLLYVDARIRSEAFDLTLQTGVAQGAPTDDLWLTPNR